MSSSAGLEHSVYIRKVTGSNPVSSTINLAIDNYQLLIFNNIDYGERISRNECRCRI